MIDVPTVDQVAPPDGVRVVCPVTVVLLAANGAPLASAEADLGALGELEGSSPGGGINADVVAFSQVAPPDALLRYYFGSGGRRIMLDHDGAVLEGRLETRWAGTGRAWWAELDMK